MYDKAKRRIFGPILLEPTQEMPCRCMSGARRFCPRMGGRWTRMGETSRSGAGTQRGREKTGERKAGTGDFAREWGADAREWQVGADRRDAPRFRRERAVSRSVVRLAHIEGARRRGRPTKNLRGFAVVCLSQPRRPCPLLYLGGSAGDLGTMWAGRPTSLRSKGRRGHRRSRGRL